MQYSGQYSGPYPVYYEAPDVRSLGYVPSGSRELLSLRNNPLFGIHVSGARPAGSLAIPHRQAVQITSSWGTSAHYHGL